VPEIVFNVFAGMAFSLVGVKRKWDVAVEICSF